MQRVAKIVAVWIRWMALIGIVLIVVSGIIAFADFARATNIANERQRAFTEAERAARMSAILGGPENFIEYEKAQHDGHR